MTARGRRLVVLIGVTMLVAAGCGDGGGGDGRALRVFAAASLTEAFTAMAGAFEAAHPGTTVRFSFAGSSALAHQINGGAGADVFASADDTNMATVTRAGNATAPMVMARNRLAIAVEPSNPRGIRSLADLGRPGVTFSACSPDVPCGRLADAALRRAGVVARPTSLDENVKAVLAKVALGEVDAGIVYATDIRAAGDEVEGVEPGVPDDGSLDAVYMIAVATAAPNPDAARAWIDHVLSGDGQATLARFGFRLP